MKKTFLFLIPWMFISTIYQFTIHDIDGNTISFSQFKGKKILIVNCATGSPYLRQLISLNTLSEKYKDSLVVIAIPSNTFRNESKSSSQIKNYLQSNFHPHFIIAEKTEVAGSAQSSLYAWLTHHSKNGMIENNLDDDFYKFLVDQQGRLVGIFAPSVDPMSDEMQSAIKN